MLHWGGLHPIERETRDSEKSSADLIVIMIKIGSVV